MSSGQSRGRAACSAPTAAVGRLPCGARSAVAPRNSLRSLRSLRSDRRGESEVEARACSARRPQPCAPRRRRVAAHAARPRLCEPTERPVSTFARLHSVHFHQMHASPSKSLPGVGRLVALSSSIDKLDKPCPRYHVRHQQQRSRAWLGANGSASHSDYPAARAGLALLAPVHLSKHSRDCASKSSARQRSGFGPP